MQAAANGAPLDALMAMVGPLQEQGAALAAQAQGMLAAAAQQQLQGAALALQADELLAAAAGQLPPQGQGGLGGAVVAGAGNIHDMLAALEQQLAAVGAGAAAAQQQEAAMAQQLDAMEAEVAAAEVAEVAAVAGGLPPAPQPLAPLMPPNPWLANANANANNGAAPGAAAGAGGAAAPGGGGAAPAGAGAGGPINPDDLHPIDAAILNDPWNPHHFFLPPFLRRRQLGDATAVGAALALEARPARLRVLELRSCRLSGALLGHVCEGLRTGAWPVLEELRLALGDLGPGDVQVLCNEGLAKMEKAGVSLRVLELSGNEVGSGVGDVGGVGLFVGRCV